MPTTDTPRLSAVNTSSALAAVGPGTAFDTSAPDAPEAVLPHARDRLSTRGATALTEEELLVLVAGNPMPAAAAAALARRIDRSPLHPCAMKEICRITGLDESAALRIHAAQELCRRWVAPRVLETPLTTSREVHERFRHLALSDVESFWSIALDPRLRVLESARVCQGTRTRCLVRPVDVLRPALAAGASALLVLHNHPSGDPEPSSHDIAITERLAKAAEVVGLRFIDHVVIARGGHVSLAERGAVKT